LRSDVLHRLDRVLDHGLDPDIAAVRDLATGWRKKLYALTSIGWTGSNEQWRHYTRGYLYLAALATPLVAFGAQRRVVGLRDGAGARLARHDLRPVLRRGRDLLGLRHGDHAAHADSQAVRPRGNHHRQAFRKPGESCAC